MNIHERQSEIGVQRSCHRVTNCNERARIDVEESRGNEEADEDEVKWDEIEKKPRREETRAKGRRKKMKKPLGSVTRFEPSNGNHKSVIASGLSKAKYNYRLLRERNRTYERNCSGLGVSRSLCWKVLQIWQRLRLELLSYRRRRDTIKPRHVTAYISVFLNKDPSKIYERGRCLMRERETHSGSNLL